MFFVSLLGLTSFILGVWLLSSSFKPREMTAQNRNQPIKTWLLFIIGLILTALCQSSSATGVLAITLLDNRQISLRQAGFFLAGTNIGTTATSQIYAFPTETIFMVLLVLTILIKLASYKYPQLHRVFLYLLAFTLMFFGLVTIRIASRYFHSLITSMFEHINTLFDGFVIGFISSALSQSSSLIMGVLVVFSEQGLISLTTAISLIFGLNLGTCLTLLLASIPLGSKGRQGAVFHIVFNSLGMLIIFALFPYFMDLVNITAEGNARIVANAHTSFNLLAFVILLPAWDVLLQLVYWIYPST